MMKVHPGPRAKCGHVALLTSLLCAAVAGHTAGQAPLELRMRAFAGTHFNRGDLPDAPILSSPTNVVSYGDVPALPTLGVGLDLRSGGVPVSLRLAVARSLSRREVGVWGCADGSGSPLPCPSIFIEVPTDFVSTAGTLDLALDAPAGPVSIRPILGMGWLRYSYEWDPSPVGAFPLDPGELDTSSLTFRYGVGFMVPVGRVRLEAEYIDHRSGTDRLRPARSGTVTAGASIPIF